MLLGLLSLQAVNPLNFNKNDSAKELAAPGGSKFITDWTRIHIKAISESKVPSQHFRQLAYMGVALYESLVAGDPNYQSLSGQLNGYSSTAAAPANQDICWQASANAAFATVMRFFYADNPMTVKRIDSMQQACKTRLANQGFSDASLKTGEVYGLQVAKGVIEWSKTDLADKINEPYALPTGPGMYEPTPPANRTPIQPHMGNCRTLVKGSCENTIPLPPVAFSEDENSEFYRMVDEVYQTSVEKNEKKVATALFWDDYPDGKTITAGGHWESIAGTIMTQMNMSLIEGARVYAQLFITMQDASVGCFKAKYMYNLMRPVTYVHKYMNKKDWMPLIATPPHPEYPAAHATCSMSAAMALTHILGDNVAFTDNTYAYRGYPEHHFANFKEAGTEAGMSRFYGGIHYMPSIEAGFEQGSKVADNIAQALVFKKSSSARR